MSKLKCAIVAAVWVVCGFHYAKSMVVIDPVIAHGVNNAVYTTDFGGCRMEVNLEDKVAECYDGASMISVVRYEYWKGTDGDEVLVAVILKERSEKATSLHLAVLKGLKGKFEQIAHKCLEEVSDVFPDKDAIKIDPEMVSVRGRPYSARKPSDMRMITLQVGPIFSHSETTSLDGQSGPRKF